MPLFIAYSIYKITRLNKGEKSKENKLHLYILIGSVIIIFGNLILWYMYDLERIEKDKRIDDLMSQNIQLLNGNKGLFSGNQELFEGQKELLDENVKIVEQNKGLSQKVEELKEVVIEKDKRIYVLERQVNNLEVAAPKIGLDGRIEASPSVSFSSDFSGGIARARKLFEEGKLNQAYAIAEDLSKKKNDFGLAYFLMGTVKIQQNDYIDGDNLLQKAIKYGLTNNDMAWAYHNLGVSSLRRNRLQEAHKFLKKCVEINPNMEESKKLLYEISQYLNR